VRGSYIKRECKKNKTVEERGGKHEYKWGEKTKKGEKKMKQEAREI